MTWIEAISLGILQGATEFLPISSSGHLVITQSLIKGFEQPGILFDVVLHLGTLLSIILYFRRDIYSLLSAFFRDKKGERRTLYLIVIATIPTGIIGLSFKNVFELLFHSITTVGVALIVTGSFLFMTSRIKNPFKGIAEMNTWDALLIGIAQGIAIIPGISRSGFTIATAIFKKIEPAQAARFSFLLSIPAVIGAMVIEAKGFELLETDTIGVYLAGTFAAALTGYIAIAYMMHLLQSKGLKPFAYYCWIVGGLVVGLNLLT